MYYNTELFVNEEIKTYYKRLNKLQTILILSTVLSVALIAIVVIIVFGVKYPDTFMTGYAMAVFVTVEFVLTASIAFPFQSKLNILRCKQTEELKGQPLYGKYAYLLNLGQKIIKTTNYISIATVAVGIIAVWVFAIFLPYGFYNVYAAILPIAVCNLILICLKKIKEIKNTETEILRELKAESKNPSCEV